MRLTTNGLIDKLSFDGLSEHQVGEGVATGMSPAAAPEERIIDTHGTDSVAETADDVGEAAPAKTALSIGVTAIVRSAQHDARVSLGTTVASVRLAGPGVSVTIDGWRIPGASAGEDRAPGRFVAA